MMGKTGYSLSYLITVSQAHVLSAQMLLLSLRHKTDAEIVLVGNLDSGQIKLFEAFGVTYIDEDDINYSGRLPQVQWHEKYRNFGWYKQQFIRLCIDRFINTDVVVILDSEVFVFDNWDERRFFDAKTGLPRYGYWIPGKRKPEWDYRMYKGAAYLLSFLPECKGIMAYVDSDKYKRSISGVALFSTQNVQKLWQVLEEKTDLANNLDKLLNHEPDLSFSEYAFYELAVEYGLFDKTVPTLLKKGLLGWYDNHDDKGFDAFKSTAMWSMCQDYATYSTSEEYYTYMQKTAHSLSRKLPARPKYWNKPDFDLIDQKFDSRKDVTYFQKYKKQLNHTFRSRYDTMYRALTFLAENKENPTIVEIGTLRDDTKGGGHSTYKFGEFCSRFGGTVHTVDILDEAIEFSRKATVEFQPWIQYHVSDSVDFFNSFDGTIDLLYLDGFDSTPGMEKQASQKQLDEITAALPKLSEQCVVLLDDADLPEGGKAGLSSKFLLDNGFTLEINAYQQLYTRTRITKPKVKAKTLIKQKTKHAIKRVVPGRILHEAARSRRVEGRLEYLEQLTQQLNQNVSSLVSHDFRLDRLRALASQVEPYQPTYGVSGIFAADTKRDSQDRCRTIEQYLGGLSGIRGKRILDIGSSIGYVDYYFADRGAVCEGWEMTPANAEVARLVGEVNGIPVNFKTKEFNSETVTTIAADEFDVAVILSVFHHVIRFNGLEYTQKLVKALFERVPTLIVELAKKGEDPKLVWDGSQPKDELAIFDLVKDTVDIKKLGEFSTHLSAVTRPLYVVSKKKSVTVNNHEYAYDTMGAEAYKGSPAAGKVNRHYYFSPEHIIKRYSFAEQTRQGKEQNTAQILNEIQLYVNVLNKKAVRNTPAMIDFEVTHDGAAIVLSREPGTLLSDLPAINSATAKLVAADVLATLSDLEKVGLHHNDVRSWNVLFDKKATLIDYGYASSMDVDNDAISTLWMLHAALSGAREPSRQHKSDLPPRDTFSDPGLSRIYAAVAKKEYSPSKLLALLKSTKAND